MIVDDELDIVRVLEIGLKRSGVNAIGFTNPKDALEYFQIHQNELDHVITDIRMHEMSGFQLARMIKRIKPGAKVTLMSAYEINRDEFDKVMPNTRIDSFITKPFPPERLVEVIKLG